MEEKGHTGKREKGQPRGDGHTRGTVKGERGRREEHPGGKGTHWGEGEGKERHTRREGEGEGHLAGGGGGGGDTPSRGGGEHTLPRGGEGRGTHTRRRGERGRGREHPASGEDTRDVDLFVWGGFKNSDVKISI